MSEAVRFDGVTKRFGAENWPFGAALTTVMMAFLMIWMIFYLRSAAKAARELPAT